MNLIKSGLILLVGILVFSCKGKEEVKSEVLRPVKYQIVGTSDAQNTRTFSGVAKAGNEIECHPLQNQET